MIASVNRSGSRRPKSGSNARSTRSRFTSGNAISKSKVPLSTPRNPVGEIVSVAGDWQGRPRCFWGDASHDTPTIVMPALVAGIHVFGATGKKDVDGRVKPGHDDGGSETRRRA